MVHLNGIKQKKKIVTSCQAGRKLEREVCMVRENIGWEEGYTRGGRELVGESRPLKSLELFPIFSSPFHHSIRCYCQVLDHLDAKPRHQPSQTSLFLFYCNLLGYFFYKKY